MNYLSLQFITWADTPNHTIDLVMKPLIPLFVEKGLVAIKEKRMIEAICRTFQDIRSQETYALSLVASPGDIDLIEVLQK